jgi:hypothetical protein
MMDRADKIFTILSISGMIALLVCSHRSRGKLAGVNMNESAAPSVKRGPAYLLSALPVSRFRDEYAGAVSTGWE